MASGRDGRLQEASPAEGRRGFLRLALAALAVALAWRRLRPGGAGAGVREQETPRDWREARHWRRI